MVFTHSQVLKQPSFHDVCCSLGKYSSLFLLLFALIVIVIIKYAIFRAQRSMKA